MDQQKAFEHIIPEVEGWPISELSEQRPQFVQEVVNETMDLLLSRATDPLDTIALTIFKENGRIKNEPWRVDPANEKKFWRKVRHDYNRIRKMEDSSEEAALLLQRIVTRYAEEIVGSFVPKTYKLARKLLTAFFKRLITRRKKQRWEKKEMLYEKLKLSGPLEQIRNLAKIGTVMICPTHFSNLDSILIAYAIDAKLGIPSLTYGAGLNLYNFGPVAYFFNRLGTYRVDRRKKNPIYLQTLKAVSALQLTKGVHSLFFPGGTRSRSGEIESKLKLGLLGTIVEAQRMNYQKDKDDKIFVVPLILGYHFVLEAKYLIQQHLKRTGEEQFLSAADQSKSKRKILKFLIQYYNKESEIFLSFGQPFDVLGNFVDFDGVSYDSQGHKIDVRDYFVSNGTVNFDKQRERVYTKGLADRITERLRCDNILISSNFVAAIAFKLIKEVHHQLDLFGILQLTTEDSALSYDTFRSACQWGLEHFKYLRKRGKIQFSDVLEEDIDSIIEDGLDNLGAYHSKKVLFLENDLVKTPLILLLYYYHNRLEPYLKDAQILAQLDKSEEILIDNH